ncbi:RNA-directed DNA polymerase [Ralstonia pseudosolanacearum]|uniref:RNA-directed DNA polymerase n=1 Tax=Ralstonia pseudosolanacearum TaxID=1310165 RepID=UPI001E334FC3|nr:RNA-directed DNA polymerase [Ralstonia pseudosolanacearum]UWD91458.1 RNA-directed DNA polymerase [Ralstonia pseudosolanacearum]CAH0441071.1 hypothetical protein LMG9673_01867 [Ralstonia pseudosolanacearum]
MSLVKTKYETLAPQMEYLSDEVVLALAWKKASAYVRRHNWYADTLELDASGLNLEGLTQSWSYEVANSLYEPTPARLVPAPKNGRWGFAENLPGGWGPLPALDDRDGASSSLTLRPLAHLGIREQTVATAVLLCMADCIETAQGNPAVKATDALGNGVFSYGNRLYCRWSDDGTQAKFSWGSSDTYSRYYADYQQFVARPREVAAALEDELKNDTRVFLVKLDISAYYDRIKIPLLIKKLQKEYTQYRGEDFDSPVDEDAFWLAAEAALTFKWSAADEEFRELLNGGELPRGLPQGLMASGFFANAYLLDLDRAIGRACQKRRSIEVGDGETRVRLHDYCRYVDDLRLVVSTDDPHVDFAELQTYITEWVQRQLDRSLGDARGKSTLTLNSAKTEIELLSHVAKATSVANRMRQVQQRLSGPFDLSSLEDLETALNGLLSMAEVEGAASRTRKPRGVPTLALVTKPPMDVRDDTLTRFAAFRLCKSLKQRRLMTDLREKREDGTAGDELQQDYELAARRLVGAWSENPSLIQVLRYAFDLYPSAALLRDVLDALTRKQDAVGHPDQAAVAWYILAELFRAAATETGQASAGDDGLKVGDIDTYRAELAQHAETVLQAGGCPWFVQQQAALLLATLDLPSDSLSDEPELARYRVLHAYLAGRYEAEDLSDDDVVGIVIVGYQLQGHKKGFAGWLRRFAVKRGVERARRALELVYKGNLSLFDAITRPGAGAAAVDRGLLNEEQALHLDSRSKDGESLPTRTWLRLSRAACHHTRPFRHENSLLRLARCLAELDDWTRPDGSIYSVFDFDVRCEDWERLDDPDGPALRVRLMPKATGRKAPRFRAPAWCKPELSWQYAIGAILRAAAVGSNDFTLGWRVGMNEPGWYRGLSSTPSRRQVGMLHSSQALGGTASSVTPWFSGLLSVLLRWPGIEAGPVEHPAASAAEMKDLRDIIDKRLKDQSGLFGRSSCSPVYRYPVRWQLRDSRALRVVVVQGLLPSVADFEAQRLDGLSNDPFRTRHRNHTAALLNLVAKKLDAYESLGEGAKKPIVDLVVFPEYSIHVDDQDLLRGFSDDTGAMLHYGLLGARHPTTGKHTNASRWLIPVRTDKRRSWIEVDQGKLHLTGVELAMGVEKWCPYRVVIELELDQLTSYRMVGAICYDATDLALAADMKNESHMFVVPAHNQDIKTFDSMIAALRYHMYQHVVICNIGEFGGSSAQAPYDEEHRRTISHAHGSNQISVAVFEVPMDHFGPQLLALAPGAPKTITKRLGKTPPAGLARRP